MTKYFFLLLVMMAMSCGEKASDSNTQTVTEPAATTTATANNSATQSEPAATPPPAASGTQETQSTPATTQSPAAEQVVPGQKSPLTGTQWRLIELNGKNIEGKTAREMYIFFDPTSPQFKSHSGCNLIMGEAKTRGNNQMWFINLLPTSGPCNTPEIDTEFQKALEEVAGYSVTGNTLVLNKKGSVPVLKFVAKR